MLNESIQQKLLSINDAQQIAIDMRTVKSRAGSLCVIYTDGDALVDYAL